MTENPLADAWLVRTGSSGAHDQWALEHNKVFIGFDEMGDVSPCQSRDDVIAMYQASRPDAKINAIRNWSSQIWAFSARMKIGDLAVLPIKNERVVAIGRVVGPYSYDATAPPHRRHTRPVEWLTTGVSRANIEQDLLYSLGAFLTVCQLTKNDAARRLMAIAENGIDPGPPSNTVPEADDVPTDIQAVGTNQDFAQAARDSLTAYVHQKYFGHAMESLIAEILRAEGFVCETHGPGTDRGIDIIAGRGPLGLDAPRLIVQVKSSKDPVGSEVLQQLSGNIADHHGADQGLLVAWGGLTKPAAAVALPQKFRIRVWSATDVIDALIRVYPSLPEHVRRDIPLSQMWVLQDVAPES